MTGITSSSIPYLHPDKSIARRLNVNMHTALRDSLIHIKESGEFKTHNINTKLSSIINQLTQGHYYPPLAFGLYYRMTFSLLQGKADAALCYLDQLADLPLDDNDAISIYALDHPFFKKNHTVYMQSIGEHDGFTLCAPKKKDITDFFLCYEDVSKTIKSCIPDLYDELSILLKNIILVSDHPNTKKAFNGMAPYQLWRLIFLNAKTVQTPSSLLETLIHETAHICLFGYTINEPLVLNPPNEKAFSPIRNEHRPIDGIFHAMFVTARVAYCLNIINKNMTTNKNGFEDLKERRDRNISLFKDNYDIIVKIAKLSQTGHDILNHIRKLIPL